jgi:threonine/homoserine/homoserine lactone efflux protein
VFSGADLVLFLTASLALIVRPGPGNLYILARGVTQGRKAALVSAGGMGLGATMHTAFATVGLSALLAQSATAFSVVKYAGAAYLVYLGARALLSKEGFAVPRGAPPAPLAKIFFQSVATDVLNPKVALFFLAFLPQFVDPAAGNAAPLFLMLGLIFVSLGLVVDCVVALFSGSIGDWLRNKALFAGALRWFMGSMLVGLGLRLALDRR